MGVICCRKRSVRISLPTTQEVRHDAATDLGSPIHRIVKVLREEGVRLFAVGDPDQCIYEQLQDAQPELLRELADASRDYASRKSLSIELELDEAMPIVPVDRRKLTQAMFSLVTNAVDASPPGETITLRSNSHTGRSTTVEIVVEDRGPGMEEEVLRKIFDPYFSTKKSGTGVGLNLTRRIIFGHQGTIEADSSPGLGCRMRVVLPVQAPAGSSGNGTDSDT